MRKALLALAVLAAFAVALAGPTDRLDNHSAPVNQHAEIIIGPPGGG